MTPLMSLRARLLLGAVLWTVGFFLLTGLVLTHVMLLNPSAPGVFHRAFSHIWLMAGVAGVSLAAGFWQVRRGMAGVQQMRARLADVHEGREGRLTGAYPAEIQPLVNDLNALLQHREETVRRALAKAGDLAHGLKTPLAVLAREGERAADAGQSELAASIGHLVERMRRQVDYHLAHARAAAAGATLGARCSVAASAEALARTLYRLHADRGLAIDVGVPADHIVRGQREDVDEMLGNLLDNACKWARARVAVTSSLEDATVVIRVDDDGPGLESSMWEAVLQRGVRADEAAPGSGFGLAIVRELAELYGGSIAIGKAPLGGVRATLTLPAA